MTYMFCHECKKERTAQYDYDPIDATMVITCNKCDAAWAFETQGSYQIRGPVPINENIPRKERD